MSYIFHNIIFYDLTISLYGYTIWYLTDQFLDISEEVQSFLDHQHDDLLGVNS